MKPIKSHTWRLRVAAFGMACSAMLCLPQASQAAHYTNNFSIGAGLNWNGNYWYDSTGLLSGLAPTPGNTYELVYNGQNANNGGNTHTRNPAANGVQSFPGDSMQMDFNTELRMNNNGATVDFPGPGGGLPGLILDGGFINVDNDGDFPITGIIQVNSMSFLSPGNNGAYRRSMDIKGQLTGSGDLVLIQSSLNQPQMISGAGNTFSGQWFVKAGWLAGIAPGSLGTNNITANPQYALPAGLGYTTNAVAGPALVDVDYDLNSRGTLTLTNGGQFSLHRNCCFAAVIINGTALTAGTHNYADLAAAYPANIVGGGPGTITVQPFGTPPVIPPNPPVGTVGLNWFHTDVGGPTLAGSSTPNSDGTITIVGGGSDIWGTSDQAHYYYAWGYGTTWDAIVEVKSFTGPDYWSKCEFMVRASDPIVGPQGRDAFIAMMANQNTYPLDGSGGGARNAVVEQFRSVAGQNADWKQIGNDPFPIYPGTWLKIHRAGPVFSLYYAKTLGTPTTWTKYVDIDTSQSTFVGGDNGAHFGTPFPDIVSVGVMVTAHNNGDPTGGIARIANLSATFPVVQVPTVIGATVQVQSVSGAIGNEASFSFATTNNSYPSGIVAVTYQWYKNGSLVAGATSTDYSFQITAADSGAQVKCRATVAPPYNTTISTYDSAIGTVTLTPGNYPMIWTGVNLGSPSPTLAGSATPGAGGTLTIVGGGADYWGNSDQGYFYYAWATSQHWDVVVDISDLQGPDSWTKCELMVRNALPAVGPQANDRFVAIMATRTAGQNIIGSQYRGTRGGGCGGGPNGPAPAYPNQWFKIHRNGSVFSLYYGTDGVNWTLYGNLDTSTSTYGSSAYPDVVAVGIAVTAHNNGDLGGGIATIANLGATFSAIQTPTVMGAAIEPPPSLSKPIGCEASLTFVATNNAIPQVVNWPGFMSYQWYKNGSLLAGATSTSHTWLLDGSDAGAQYFCLAMVLPPFNAVLGPLSSSFATITLAPGIYYTNGLKVEMFTGVTARTAVEQGNVPPATWIGVMPNFDNPGGYGDNYVSRVSGWFIPPATDYYVFFVASDDDSDLYLSTDATIEHKQLIAQETGWSGTDQWLSGGPQARSDRWTNTTSGGIAPYAAGIPLNAGQLYYIENVHHNGGGGDNFGVTFQTTNNVAATNLVNGTPSWLQAASNNIVLVTYASTTLAWTFQPTNTTVSQGQPATFYGRGASDSEFALNYQWLRGGAPIAGATRSSYTIAATGLGDNLAQFRLAATTAEKELSITSSVVTLTVTPGVWESGFATMDFWGVLDGTGPGDIRAAVEGGTAPAPNVTMAVPRFEAGVNGENGSDYVNRVSGYFMPPATDDYVFFVCSDDQSELYISNDILPTGKYRIAQETDYSGVWQWLTVGGGTAVTQKRSDQWSPDGVNVPYAAGIRLTNGLRYYMEVVHHEGGGGDNVEVTYKTLTGADPANGTDSQLMGNVIGLYAPRITRVSFAQQPTNVTVPFGGSVTLTAKAGPTDSKIAIGTTGQMSPWTNNFCIYKWQRNGVDIPGATSPSFSFGPVTPLDSGAQFICQIRALGYADISLTPIWSNSTPASVTVQGNPVYEPGFALHSFYGQNPSRAQIETNQAGSPDWIMASPAFSVGDTGVEIADNFSDQLISSFIPSVTGDYVFFVNADDDTDLFLSTDSSSINRRLIAQETGAAGGALQWSTGNATQHRSDTFVDPSTGLTPYATGIHLIGGQKYFMQMVHHQGGGNTYSCVTAKLISDADPANGAASSIRGSEVGSYVPRCTFVTVTNNPQSVTTNSYASATFTAAGATDSLVPIGPEGDWRPFFSNFLEFQWYKSGQPVAGATTSVLKLPLVLPEDNGAQITCSMRALGYAYDNGTLRWTNSLPATLTVITGAPPQLLYSALYTNNTGGIASTRVTLNFSGPMNPVALLNQGNYLLGGGLSIVPDGITVNSNTYQNVTLTVTGTPTFPFTVTINNASAFGGGPALAGSPTTTVNLVLLANADIGTPPGDPSVPSGFFPSDINAFNIQCEGSDIWGNADGFNFAYEVKTGDFDVVVRQKNTTHTSNWAKGGLMVRETLEYYSRNWNIVNDPASADGIGAPDGSGNGANAVECNARVDTSGGSAAWSGGVAGTVPAYPNAWVRLTRVGQILTAYWSTNNAASWNLAATNSPAAANTLGEGDLPATVYVGICATAHNNDAAGTPASQLRFMAYMDFDSYNSSWTPVSTVRIGKPVVSGSNVTITWAPALGTLYASPAIKGPLVNWVSVGTGGSVTLPMTPAPRFFKVAP